MSIRLTIRFLKTNYCFYEIASLKCHELHLWILINVVSPGTKSVYTLFPTSNGKLK